MILLFDRELNSVQHSNNSVLCRVCDDKDNNNIITDEHCRYNENRRRQEKEKLRRV